jgi:uncharacterized RDD family membrane protein YckC
MKIRKYVPQYPVIADKDLTLARFWPRAIAIIIDLLIIGTLVDEAAKILNHLHEIPGNVNFHNFHVEVTGEKLMESEKTFLEIFFGGIPILYFALCMYFTNGKTIGKWIARVRVVSIYHHRISFWHCVERALGYGASGLEGGLGFLQIFWNPNRMCLHDRIAETIVIRDKKKK